MKRILILIVFLVFAGPILPQTKYFIYFKDKGVSANEALKKTASDISAAYKYISPRSVERRLKSSVMPVLNFEDLPVNPAYTNVLKQNGIEIKNTLKWFNTVTAYLTDEEKNLVEALPFVNSVGRVKELSYKKPEIEKAEGDFTFRKAPEKTDALDYGQSYAQYALSEIQSVHNAGISGEGVIIGILDSGFDWKLHESLTNANVLNEYDFVFHDNITADENEDVGGQHTHGTMVFSVIGGYKEGAIIGPAYNAKFVLAKTEYTGSETHLEEDNYAAALEWMDSIGVDITTASLGYSNSFTNGDDYKYSNMDGKTAIVTIAAEKAFAKGITVLNAVGNEGDKIWHYMNAPADGANVIAVGAVTGNSEYAAFSSHGPTYDGRIKPEITARGVSIYGAAAGSVSDYGYSSGTSLSTPIASGIAGLLLSAYPHLTNIQMRNILIYSGDNWKKPDNNIGYGLLSARRAINYPNIEVDNGIIKLHKAFIAEIGVDPNSIKLIFPDSSNPETLSFSHINSVFYSANISQSKKYFYVTYKDSSGGEHREPDNPYYYAINSNDNTITPIDTLGRNQNLPSGYALDNNYPNPFNSYTRIIFYSIAEDYAELYISDILGRRVRTLYKDKAIIGENKTVWDGKSDNGYLCSSGIYYYTLKIADKEYSKKMVLVK
ncbi:MAG TPA: S8 family serine peptidase [Ignavibacteriales bacterium]|nr:S8 family serine peptidase [Ignavibacteriales bacterium]